ncbi:MAG: coproporphyrinogen dehydrogenase HemZ [Clostridia bacterium]|nr:coproporphyrinogen dehydrogenase HemZ [Clostridia bacterium]
MQILIKTNLPEFQNDIGDVVRLFFGEGTAIYTGDEENICEHSHSEQAGNWTEQVRFVLDGRTVEHTLSEPAAGDTPVEHKRLMKRLTKRTVYLALKAWTGRVLPWGSLTGIRPARLFRQQMDSGKTFDETVRQFRMDFDVSPERINLITEILEAQKPYLLPEPGTVDLYIGIPFCTTRCSYCSFSSGEIGDGHLVEPYLSALLHELDAVSDLVRTHGLAVRTAYIGGGTPTSLGAAQMDRLLSALFRAFPDITELTVEAGRPDTVDREKLTVLKQYPVTRISINPQTMNDSTLQAIGRAHTAQQCIDTYHLAREMGFTDINMDIITALPGEDLSMFEHTLEVVENLSPDSLTVHTLAIKHSSKLHEQRYEQRIDEMIQQMADKSRECAHRMGLRAYYLYRQKYMASNLENVGYAGPEKICRYNIDNMEETASVLALGAGGISKRIMGRDQRILRAPNVSNIEAYISRVDEMIERKAQMLSYAG